MFRMAKRKNPKRAGKPIALWLSVELTAALERYRTKQDVPPSKSAVCRHALKLFLESKEAEKKKSTGIEE